MSQSYAIALHYSNYVKQWIRIVMRLQIQYLQKQSNAQVQDVRAALALPLYAVPTSYNAL